MEESRYFYMEKVYRGWNLPVFLLDAKGQVTYRPEGLDRDPDPDAAAQIRCVCMKRGMPQIWFEGSRVFYMGFVAVRNYISSGLQPLALFLKRGCWHSATRRSSRRQRFRA